MSICTFFGHHDSDSCIRPALRKTIEDVIVNKGIKEFYVGNQGAFDKYVLQELKELKKQYPKIVYWVILAYMPCENKELIVDEEKTMLPDGIESVPRRFAISYRNKWMVKKSNYVITYITRSYGGAAKFAEMAKKQSKEVINIAERVSQTIV